MGGRPVFLVRQPDNQQHRALDCWIRPSRRRDWQLGSATETASAVGHNRVGLEKIVTQIDRAELLRLVEEEDAQVVDVLPDLKYADSHIPDARPP